MALSPSKWPRANYKKCMSVHIIVSTPGESWTKTKSTAVTVGTEKHHCTKQNGGMTKGSRRESWYETKKPYGKPYRKRRGDQTPISATRRLLGGSVGGNPRCLLFPVCVRCVCARVCVCGVRACMKNLASQLTQVKDDQFSLPHSHFSQRVGECTQFKLGN